MIKGGFGGAKTNLGGLQFEQKTNVKEAVTQLARHLRPESAHTYIHLDTDEKKKIADKVFD